MGRAADLRVCRSPAASIASGLVVRFRVTTTKILFVFVRDVDVACRINVSDTEARLTFVKSGYLMVGHIP